MLEDFATNPALFILLVIITGALESIGADLVSHVKKSISRTSELAVNAFAYFHFAILKKLKIPRLSG